MLVPTEITFRNMRHSDAIETTIRKMAAKLSKFYPVILSCRVMVETAHGNHTRGRLYHVRVDVRVPEAELVASAEPAPEHRHDDIYVAIHEAFDAVRRELEDYARRRRGQVKLREAPARGRVVKLFPRRGFGFVGTRDGGEV